LAAAVVFAWIFAKPHSGKIGEAAIAPAAAAPRNISRAANGETDVQISIAEQSRIGLVIKPLKAVTKPIEFTAYGAVVDPAPLMALNSQLEAAQSTLAASRSQFDRARLLHSEGQSVSLKDMQTAEAKFRADAAQFQLLSQQLADNWGESIAAMPPTTRAALIDALVHRTEAIVRAALPAGESISGKPAAAQVLVLGYETHPLTTQWIAYDPTVDPRLQGQGFLLRVEAQGFPLRPGAAVTARMAPAGPPRHGFVIPDAAVIRTGEVACVYVGVASNRFERRTVALAERTEGGWFATARFAAGDQVVVTGAQTLLSKEMQPEAQNQQPDED
jgi:hypothetical protein